jgi:hypothetical protein
MKRSFIFASFGETQWTDAGKIEPFFLDSKQREAMFIRRQDDGLFSIDGMEGTDNLSREADRVNARLYLNMLPEHGVTISYHHWDGRSRKKTYFYSKGNLDLINEYVRSFQGSPLQLGLFIPYEAAWRTVKEFMEGDGGLPASIDWVSAGLPPIPDSMFFKPQFQ